MGKPLYMEGLIKRTESYCLNLSLCLDVWSFILSFSLLFVCLVCKSTVWFILTTLIVSFLHAEGRFFLMKNYPKSPAVLTGKVRDKLINAEEHWQA